MTETQDDYLGKVILGRYRIVRILARGGMGVIYLARSEGAAGFVKPFVVKRILADLVGEENMVKMFKREARIMSNLRHPGIVSVIDFGQERNSYFMVLDYIHGFHLGRWYRFMRATYGKFAAELAIHVVISVLDALHYAHTLILSDGRPAHIVHRDVTPSNILIDVDGHVKLADFGIAQMKSEATEFKTNENMIKGKFPYLPPELFRGGEPSPLTDVYACGVVLHELLMGKNEFRMKDVSSTITRVLQHTPSTIETVRDDAPQGLDAVLAKALAKDPKQRYQTAAELAQALRAIRKWNSDEAAAKLIELANRDFQNPAMADFFGIPQLVTLDNAWRKEVPETLDQVTVVEADSSNSIHVPDESGDALRTPSRGQAPSSDNAVGAQFNSKTTWAMAVFGLLLLGGGVVGFFALRSMLNQVTNPVIVYREEGDALSAKDNIKQQPTLVIRAPDATAPSAEETSQENKTAPTISHSKIKTSTKPAAQDSARAFSAAFAQKRDQIRECFASHASQVVGTPKISVRFQVNTNGSVDTAGLEPNALNATPLGACLVRVAKTTQFPEGDTPIVVRIPITTTATNK